MCSLCRLPVVKNHNFWQFFIFGDSCTDPLLPMRIKFGVLERTQGLHLHAKFHFNVFMLSASGGQKPQFSANFDIFWGSCTLLIMRAKFYCAVADPRCVLTCQILSRLVYSVDLWRRKTPIFAVYWTSAFCDVTNWHQSLKLEHGCTTTNLPLSNSMKIVSVLQRIHGEIGRTISDIQKRDEQTDRQTKNSTFLATPAEGEI